MKIREILQILEDELLLELDNTYVNNYLDNYGAWITGDGEVLPVPDHGHEGVADQYLESHNIDLEPFNRKYDSLYEMGWIRLAHPQGMDYFELNITGMPQDIIKNWPKLAAVVEECEYITVDIAKREIIDGKISYGLKTSFSIDSESPSRIAQRIRRHIKK